MNYPKKITFLLVLLILGLQGKAQYCPGCDIDYSYTVPGVYPVSLPPAIAGEYYETDLTFVLAEDTATDFGTFEFLNYHIMEPLGMPYGLNASSDLGDFPVDYDPDVSLYGCVKVCGTPLIAGVYNITVPLIATLEDPAGDQPAEYYLSIEVLPPAGSSGGFSASTTFGCSPSVINFTTSYPSDGVDGFSYAWDFGNGFTSVDEIPSPQFYTASDVPETYIVSHTVTIDTVGYTLDYVKITGTNCDDCTFFGCTGLFPEEKPDLYIIIDELGINTFPGFADTDPPVTFILDTEIDPSTTYTLEAKDDDGGATGGDDNCGNEIFYGDAVGITTLDIGASNVEISISHPVITYTFYDTIVIYPVPAPPVVTATSELEFCEGDSVFLSAAYNPVYSYQWYQDALPIVGADSSAYIAFTNGNYSLIVTAEGGCADTSEIFSVSVYEYPPALVILVDDNLLYTTNDYSVQWYYEGDAIPGATDLEYVPAIEGTYSVCATNVFCTTCSPELSFVFQQISDIPIFDFQIYPNPNDGKFILEGKNLTGNVTVEIQNMLGEEIFSKQMFADGNLKEEFNLGSSAEGMYYLEVKQDNTILQQLILKQ
ncbi:MAG: T9SS type A sorting domain-containing protein [Chitinophagales bacterium]